MFRALILAVRQLQERRLVGLLARCLLITLGLLLVLGTLGWWLLDAALVAAHVQGSGVLAVAGAAVGGWLLWRVIALAVLQVHADAVVAAIEARDYPAAFATARPLGHAAEARQALRGAARAIGWNLVALPFAIALLVTGVGTALLFWAVNAVLLGRELIEMVALRHPGLAPVSLGERLGLGGAIAALALVPFVNLLAPFVGAAAATHLVHGREGVLARVG